MMDETIALLAGEEKSCGKKIKYSSWVVATKAAYCLESQRVEERFDVYRCPFCNFIHIGHNKNFKRKNILDK